MSHIKLLCFGLVLLGSVSSFAEPTKSCFPSLDWSSKNTSDVVTIQNGNNTPLIVLITVAKSAQENAAIAIRNCGSTVRIGAGNSAICANADGNNPINFNSESSDSAVNGTYQIQEQ